MPLLIDVVAYLTELLCVRFSPCTFMCDMEYVIMNSQKPGQNPADAEVVLSHVDGKLQQVVLFEYKPSVDTRSLSVNDGHLLQLLIEAYYYLTYHSIPACIFCLTDLQMWYYFKIKKGMSTGPLIQIEWAKVVQVALPYKKQEFVNHVFCGI